MSFSSSSNATTPFSKSTPACRGYLAFPAGFNLTPEQKVKSLKNFLSPNDDTITPDLPSSDSANSSPDASSSESIEEAWKARLDAELQRRRLLEEREREEALRGEKEWVRSGGILRDANGRRDFQRTAEIKKLVEEEEARKRALTRWTAYESGWAKLSVSPDPVTSQSIPWPLIQKPQSASDLRDSSAVAQFLFETLGQNGSAATRKERLRSSLLRWHPDKLGGLLSRASNDEWPVVKDGVDAVVMSLMKLQDMEKADRA